MVKVNKVIQLFSIMRDSYDLKVENIKGNGAAPKGLKITLTIEGVEATYWPKNTAKKGKPNKAFTLQVVTLGRELLGEPFSEADVNKLILQLESIAEEVVVSK